MDVLIDNLGPKVSPHVLTQNLTIASLAPPSLEFPHVCPKRSVLFTLLWTGLPLLPLL
jgi:hypothetical protein